MPASGGKKRVNVTLVIDSNGLISAVGAGIETAMNYPARTLIGRPVEALITAIDDLSDTTNLSIHRHLLQLTKGGERKAQVLQSNGESTALSISVEELVLQHDKQLLVTLQAPARSSFEKWITDDWQRVFRSAERAIAISSADGKKIELVSTAFAAMHGYTVDELIGKSLAELSTDDRRDELIAHIESAIRAGNGHFETTLAHRLGHPLQMAIDFATIRNEDGSIAYTIAYLLDNSEQKRNENALRIRNEFLQASYDQAAVATAVCDLEGRFISVNAAMCEFIGYTEAELLSMHFSDITHPDDVRQNLATREQALLENLKTYSQEKRYIHKNGEIIWSVLVVSLVNDKHGNAAFTLGQMIDLEKDPATGQRLKWAYEQRNNLVREVHHRIKNNLQSVTGLLRRHIYANPAAGDTLRQAITQVEAIAVVHGLESSGGNRRIRICDIMCGIVGEANKLQAETDAIKYPTVLERPALVRSEEAVPIALILSELLTNAIKHHCPLHALDIRISIERNTPELVCIAISNPAQAPAPGFDFANGKGIGQGLKLVRAMMPKKDMHINFDYMNGDMTATITLNPPIIYADVGGDFNESPNPTIENVVQ